MYTIVGSSRAGGVLARGDSQSQTGAVEKVPTSNVVGRVAAVLALAVAAVVVVMLLLGGGGSSYTVTAKFQNASQLVKGNPVKVAGVSAGSIEDIKLADDGQALVELSVSDQYAPLDHGTHATIRSSSLSGIARGSLLTPTQQVPQYEMSTTFAAAPDSGPNAYICCTSAPQR